MTLENKTSPIGVWKFAKQAIDTFEKLNDKSLKAGLEYGTNLCGRIDREKDKFSIIASGECVGSECEIKDSERFRKRCPPDTIWSVGEFHTHPKEKKFIPSVNDLLRKEHLNLHVACIGSPSSTKKEDRIKCLTSKFAALEPERIKSRTEKLEKISKGEIGYKRVMSLLLSKDYHIFNPKDYMEKED